MDRFPLRRYASRPMLILAGLGFASGLPSSSTALGDALAGWMGAIGVKVKDITLLAYVTLPVGCKVLWAPLLDRYAPPWLGRRRGWLVTLQGLLALAMGAMALFGPEGSGDDLTPLVIAGVFVAFLSASQDVVADAYRADVVAPEERAAGAAMFVNGYRVAILAGTSGALLLSDVLPWRGVFGVLAATMLASTAVTLAAQEPPASGGPRAGLAETLVEPWRDLARRFGPGLAVALAFIACFGVPDEAGRRMTMPLLQLRLGFTAGEIAFARQALGLGVAVVGAFAAGPVVARLGLARSLFLFGLLQAATNLGFVALEAVGHSLPALVAVVLVENGTQGMVGAGFVAYLMALCDRRWSASQYALFTSVWFLVRTLLAGWTGALVEAVGYGPAFVLSAVAGIPALLLIPWLPLPADARPAATSAGD